MPNVNKIVNQNIRAINTVLIVSVYEMPKLSSSLFTHILEAKSHQILVTLSACHIPLLVRVSIMSQDI